ncbi:hypothetical protein [Mucilaginibacter kameinonensis]|uniref:hypothetical protein n=1 Tax=Mucilaginibacter kameinonensis TaxID=452286 RepID=UPI0013CEC152|nr:hypothetical protein [Mucilaginibacter kameinonensis]
MRSTKSRFDHTAFQNCFAFNADPILAKLLEAYSAAKSDEQIVDEMRHAAFTYGHKWLKKDIHEFIRDKFFVFRLEIATTTLLKDMIDMGYPQLLISSIVSQLCGNLKPLLLLQ